MKNKLRVWISKFLRQIADAPVDFWLILGLLIASLVFYFVPTFFRSPDSMLQGAGFISPRKIGSEGNRGIGGDHDEIVNGMSRAFLMDEPRFVLKGPYPPFSILFHLPFILLDSRTSYLLISLLTLAAFLLTTLVLPGLIQSTKWTPAIVAIFFTGLFSYGFQFEVERGQVNLFAVSCALASVWIFHRRPRLRWLAYLLFSAAAQLKVYPVIFIVNLVDDWRDWKAILKRFVGLGLLNFALLFLLGIDNFFRFFGGLSSMVVSENAASQNHSIGSYVGLLVEKLPSLSGYSSYLVNAFLALVLFCLVLIGYQAYRNRLTGLNPLFLLACAVAAQLIPRVSFDYTLSILPAAMAFFMAGADKIRKSVFSSAALLVICAAYGSTLFSNTYKYAAKELMPVLALFSNNFPALILILVAVASLSFSLLPGQETPPQRSLETYE